MNGWGRWRDVDIAPTGRVVVRLDGLALHRVGLPRREICIRLGSGRFALSACETRVC